MKKRIALLVACLIMSPAFAFAMLGDDGGGDDNDNGNGGNNNLFDKDLCKNGGFVTQGFDNQGQCVSYYMADENAGKTLPL